MAYSNAWKGHMGNANFHGSSPAVCFGFTPQEVDALLLSAPKAAMQDAAEAALSQIEDRKYASGLPPRVTQVIKYGVAFCKKECLVLKQG